ncbi:transcriptional regulator family: Fungal Specific TF [Trichoderma aggressivum f. europaeum]|uniref:Transcriptional regulator family: Fungal Specific TF n=1 Tax=Trichoderma aggressivum f. europaeum TaxID=173218 RepID=A0AAE1LWU7_9HYPO|nr:transcriptional regulator family: Fungal Specific TF [Trichoderma aggressivum f. europaeum]
MTCVYPVRDPDAAQKPCTLRDVSNRLERLESLLSLLVERSGAFTGFEADGGSIRGRGRAEPEITIQPRPISDNANTIRTGRQQPSNRPLDKSTWELLMNNTNIEPLLQEERSKLTQPPGPEPTPSQSQANTASHHRLATQLGTSAPLDRDSGLLDVYPDAQLALRLWNVYVRSVDPVLKILHIPTIQSAVVATILDTRSAQPSMVALTFAIYYAAVTALCHYDCDEPVDLSWEKPVLLKRYQIALDRLLVTPDFMKRPDVTGLQALAIYVTCSRANELGRPVWVLNGLMIRLARSIGLHRDGASLKLSLFESEMRLRLWWHLCVLESRASEDQGFQPAVDITNTGLRLPLNVNDDQIYPDLTHFPEDSVPDGILDIRENGRRIHDPAQYMTEKYGIVPGSKSVTPVNLPPIATQHVTTACEKMKFVLQLRKEISLSKQKEVQDDDATPDALKLSFKLACDCLESSHVLLKEGLASRFTWLFSMYTQWYALAYVLRCLCSNPSPRGFEADRAWVLVEELFPRGPNLQGHPAAVHDERGHGRIWKFLNQLRHQAWSLRQHAQTSAATANVGARPSGDERYWTCQRFSDAEILPPKIGSGTSIVPEWVSEFPASSDQSVFASLDLLMPEIPFLPDWNAVINGQ